MIQLLADEFREPGHAAGVHHDGSRDRDDGLTLLLSLAREGRGLANGGFHLALGRNFVRHEGEGEAVALLRFGRDANAAHADHDHVAGFEIAQAAAVCGRGFRSVFTTASLTTIIASMR